MLLRTRGCQMVVSDEMIPELLALSRVSVQMSSPRQAERGTANKSSCCCARSVVPQQCGRWERKTLIAWIQRCVVVWYTRSRSHSEARAESWAWQMSKPSSRCISVDLPEANVRRAVENNQKAKQSADVQFLFRLNTCWRGVVVGRHKPPATAHCTPITASSFSDSFVSDIRQMPTYSSLVVVTGKRFFDGA